MSNITVPAYAILDIEDRKDIHLNFNVEGATPEDQIKAARDYAKNWAEFNEIDYRSIKVYVGVSQSSLDEVHKWFSQRFD